MRLFAIVVVTIFAFLILPIHYIVVMKFAHAADYPKSPVILLVIIAFLASIFTAGYNETRE
ncbi:hypothetical protein AWH56_000110 [Anaerobacillus isosaccharinicus]|uniref:Uncharacterized protein n=1 Tax=Anaerobacillus isosaccharinicus TaxID=1532552 RepID=A0A1S2LR14_9BACI|nr:hypothetical protein [Anaerobacillus isosaccharinicus]MBA5585543.1 hypothetical protein [Anaerobacillus isosaccharinicus]QOY36143.1 hypothetical protein AWH56_000110 [Anaerobacillus isosaccharinicus]